MVGLGGSAIEGCSSQVLAQRRNSAESGFEGSAEWSGRMAKKDFTPFFISKRHRPSPPAVINAASLTVRVAYTYAYYCIHQRYPPKKIGGQRLLRRSDDSDDFTGNCLQLSCVMDVD